MSNSKYEHLWQGNFYEDDTTAHFYGEYLLDEEIWTESGLYLSEYDTKIPDILEDEEIVEIVDTIIWRMMK